MWPRSGGGGRRSSRRRPNFEVYLLVGLVRTTYAKSSPGRGALTRLAARQPHDALRRVEYPSELADGARRKAPLRRERARRARRGPCALPVRLSARHTGRVDGRGAVCVGDLLWLRRGARFTHRPVRCLVHAGAACVPRDRHFILPRPTFYSGAAAATPSWRSSASIASPTTGRKRSAWSCSTTSSRD